MPKQLKALEVTNHIKVDGIDHYTNEYSKKEIEKMFSEMTQRTMLELGYTPVKTA